MYEPIKDTLDVLLAKYLVAKFDTTRLQSLVDADPELLTTVCREFDEAITEYNKLRATRFPDYLINAIELNKHFNRDLPLFNELKLSAPLVERLGSQLRDEEYLEEVWQIGDSYALLCNITLLLYRNYVLTTYASTLVNHDGSRKVQVSSSIEELVFQLSIKGRDLGIRRAFLRWLIEWKEEGFSEVLYSLINKPSTS